MKSSAPDRTRRPPQSKPRQAHGAKASLGLQDDRMTGRFFLPAREAFKAQVTPQTARRHWRGTKQNPWHLLGTRPAHPEWSCLGTCQCRSQRPTQPREGERIKQRICFLFSCKKHLPSGYKCYCICVALYCCPQLASITGPQWQYFYNP